MSTSEEPTLPTLDQPVPEASSSNAPPPAPRSIKLFFGGAPPRVNPFSLDPDASKRRRMNADGPPVPAPVLTQGQVQNQKQGRIVLGSGWGVGRHEDEASDQEGPKGKGKGKGRGRPKKSGGGGEEDELKEMGKRAKAAQAQAGKGGKRKKGKAYGQEGSVQQLDLKADDGDHTEDSVDPVLSQNAGPFSAPSPSPKKRGRPAKRKPNEEGSKSRKTTRSLSTDHPIAYVRSSSPHDPNDIVVTGEARRAVPKHPIFSRTNTGSTVTGTATNSQQGQSQKDPIDLEAESSTTVPTSSSTSVKPGPKKLVFASDHKPAHSFFSRKVDQQSSQATPEPTGITGETELPESDTGTTLPDGPVVGPKPVVPLSSSLPNGDSNNQMFTGPSKKVHNFFQTNGSGSRPSTLKLGWGNGIREGGEWLPPWPGAAWPTHEGSGATSVDTPTAIKRRPRPRPTPAETHPAFWGSILADSAVPKVSDPSKCSNGKRKRPDHLASTYSDSNRETLCERFRPRSASQVLGNTNEATYLRDWLSALSIGTQDGQGPRVTRRVAKKKRKFDDWIVDDIGLFGDPILEDDSTEPEPEPLEDPNLELGVRPLAYAPFSTWLTNTILLAGPSGSGKSAAVYAAANELGWEVFEVYPGIGKRTGGNLMSLVGDVGRNHMVGRHKEVAEQTTIKQTPGEGGTGLKSFFQTKTKSVEIDEDGPPLGSQGEPIEIDDDHDHNHGQDTHRGHLGADRPTTPPPRHKSTTPATPFRDENKFRQSLILIEEVDILFDEEATFWPAIISLIAESRRPVVLTCNDIERVMCDSIPLQAILHFEPPSRDLAVPYLNSLCNRLDIDSASPPGYTSGLYERSVVHRPRTVQAPGPPNGNEILPYFDLRRAIMQLQLEMGHFSDLKESTPTPTTCTQAEIAGLDEVVKRAEVLSYTDAYLDERSWAVMELDELDRYHPSADDQLGVHTLLKAELPDRIPTLPAYDRTREIASSFRCGSSSRAEDIPEWPTTSFSHTTAGADLITDQIQYIRTLLPLLDPIIPLSAHLLPHPSLFVEYMPAIQNLVQIDDIRQAGYEAAKAAGEDLRNFRTGRPVRINSWRNQEYERALELDEEALEVARTRLRYGHE